MGNEYDPAIIQVSTNLNYENQIDPISGNALLLPTTCFIFARFWGKQHQVNLKYLKEDNSPFMVIEKARERLDIFFNVAGTGEKLADGQIITGHLIIKRIK